MMRLVAITIFVIVVYFILRNFMRMVKRELNRRSDGGSHQYGNHGHANTEAEYREILGVTNKDTPEAIKTKYKELLTKYHPDKVQHLGVEFQEMADRKTKAIMEAYEFFQKKYDL